MEHIEGPATEPERVAARETEGRLPGLTAQFFDLKNSSAQMGEKLIAHHPGLGFRQLPPEDAQLNGVGEFQLPERSQQKSWLVAPNQGVGGRRMAVFDIERDEKAGVGVSVQYLSRSSASRWAPLTFMILPLKICFRRAAKSG
jgi:hypothetical protein